MLPPSLRRLRETESGLDPSGRGTVTGRGTFGVYSAGMLLETKLEHLETVLDKHTAELALGEFLVVSPGQIRVGRRSPS
jgi:hypothetical protein